MFRRRGALVCGAHVDRETGAAAPVHFYCPRDADRAARACSRSCARRPTSFRTSISRWSPSSGATRGCSPEDMATRLILSTPSAPRRPRSTTSSTPSRSRSPGIAVIEILLPAERQRGDVVRADHRGLADATAPGAPRHHPALRPRLQRLYGADAAAGARRARRSRKRKLFDLGNNIIRTALATVPGASMPYPYGGKQRQVQVDLDPEALRAKGLSGSRRQQRHRQPEPGAAGRHREDRRPRILRRYQRQPADHRGAQRRCRSAPSTARVVYVHDVAHVRDGYPPQTNIVRVDGHHGC